MPGRIAFIGLLASLALAVPPAAAQGTPAACTFGVGFRVVTFNQLKTAIWYPTSDRETSYSYTPDIVGSIAKDGAPSTCARFPLIVFSHGLGGCGTQSIFFTEQLARNGYIVAAPDHKDAACSVDGTAPPHFTLPQDSFFEPDKWNDTTRSDRKDDLALLITSMLASSDFGSRIDPERIGAAGHSLGGYAVVGMAGGWPSWKDKRIRAVLPLSPYILPFLTQNRLSAVDIPLMYEGAQLDIAITPFLKGNSGGFAQANLPKFFLELVGGTHFEWTNLVCVGIPRVSDCIALKPNARLIVGYAAIFFDRYLKQEPGVTAKLDGTGLASYLRTVPLSPLIAASYDQPAGVAPDSIVSAFGEGIAFASASAVQLPLPITLGSAGVVIRDSQGTTRTAPLFFASAGQINFLVPKEVNMGRANVSVMIGGQEVAVGTMQVNRTAPGVFSADASGKGVAAAQYLRASASGARTTDLVFNASLDAVPIDLGSDSDSVYLMLYGTGLRGLSGPPVATVGGQPVGVAGPVPHSVYVGLDQINLGPLPRSLAGKGLADIVLTVDGRSTNPVQVRIR